MMSRYFGQIPAGSTGNSEMGVGLTMELLCDIICMFLEGKQGDSIGHRLF